MLISVSQRRCPQMSCLVFTTQMNLVYGKRGNLKIFPVKKLDKENFDLSSKKYSDCWLVICYMADNYLINHFSSNIHKLCITYLIFFQGSGS